MDLPWSLPWTKLKTPFPLECLKREIESRLINVVETLEQDGDGLDQETYNILKREEEMYEEVLLLIYHLEKI
jgi:hypothetical protein